MDCYGECGGNYIEDYCGICNDPESNDNITDTVGGCEIATGSKTREECGTYGRWEEETELCYCPVGTFATSKLGVYINNCDLCAEFGTGPNDGCDD